MYVHGLVYYACTWSGLLCMHMVRFTMYVHGPVYHIHGPVYYVHGPVYHVHGPVYYVRGSVYYVHGSVYYVCTWSGLLCMYMVRFTIYMVQFTMYMVRFTIFMIRFTMYVHGPVYYVCTWFGLLYTWSGSANGNARLATRLYTERFSIRHLPVNRVFTRLHQRLRDSGSFEVNKREAGGRRRLVSPAGRKADSATF